MSDTIKFYKGEETGIVHESYKEKETSLFKDQYDKALSEIGAYLSYYKTIDEINIESNDEEDDEQITKQNKSKKQPQYIELNNIFAFIGERGTGKTSCMKSVADMLYQYRKSTNKNGCEKFLKIDPIDPTIFDDNTNLMQVVIGVMFEKFKDKVANSDNLPCNADRDTYEKNKQNLLKSFQDVKECIKYISNPDLLKCEDDDISQLAGMASVSKLNDRIGKLADRYLEFFDKNILVLQIDDIDLQTKYAYQMVEEIRKYFMHKNIIILMAVKMEQLAKVIENETAKQYEPLKNLKGITLPEISDMAIRYLLKLIPINHRIYMPMFEVYADSLIEYLPNHEQGQKSLIGDGSPISVKYAITTLIFEKCRFLFYHSKGVVSPIVPRNLRELRHLLVVLESMPKIIGENQKKDNKDLFLRYFYSTWVSNNISAKDLAIVRNIEQIKDVALINKVVVQQLFDRYSSLFIDGKEIIEPFKEIFNVRNTSYNISIADVYTVVDYIRRRKSGIDDRMLVFFISTFYSFRLYEYYDELTDKIEEKAVLQSDEHKKRHPDDEIRTEEVTDRINNYQALIGGCFVNTNDYKFIPKEQNQSKGKLRINFNKLKEASKLIVSKENGWLEEYKINLIEFLALSAHRVYETTEPGYTKYRSSNDLYYDFSSERKYDSLVFDLGSFFFNVIDIERAYNRINTDLFTALKDNENSLYRKLIKGCLKQRELDESCSDTEKRHVMLSCVSIRNYEVLSYFISETEYNWTDRSKGKLIQNLSEYFKKVANCKINLYDRKDGGNEQDRENRKPESILFKYADVIVGVLENEDYNEFLKGYLSYESNEIKGFDVDGLMQYFSSREYKPIAIKRVLHKYCKSIFDSDREWDNFLNALIEQTQVNEKGKISKRNIKDIVSRLNVRYKMRQRSQTSN